MDYVCGFCMRKIWYYLVSCVLLFCLVEVADSQVTQDREKVDFQFSVIHNYWDGKTLGSRNLYILLEEKNFTIGKIKQLLRFLSKSCTTPKSLSVKIFTDSDRLKQTIGYDNPGASISFLDTEAGRKAAKEWDEMRFPKPKGYYAEYFRGQSRDFFYFSPEKDGPTLSRINFED